MRVRRALIFSGRKIMEKTVSLVWLLCGFCLLSGCTAARSDSASSPAEQKELSSPAVAAQKVPPGMRLGAPYTSALGENCYQVIAEQVPAPPGQALCLRQQGWELLPSIYMDIPAAEAQAAKKP